MRYSMEITVEARHVDRYGRMTPASILYLAQEAAGAHCRLMGKDYDSLAQMGLFWAVSRHRVAVERLPRLGEAITVHTWPMPATRVAYPRATELRDAQGHVLVKAVSLWVLMDVEKRAMVLPGKSGIAVNGILRGTELDVPHSLVPQTLSGSREYTVTYSCLDRNGHMNNTKYLDWVTDLLSSRFHAEHSAREFVICYLSEARESQQLRLDWALSPEGLLQVHAHREKTDVSQKQERVFSAQILF